MSIAQNMIATKSNYWILDKLNMILLHMNSSIFVLRDCFSFNLIDFAWMYSIALGNGEVLNCNNYSDHLQDRARILTNIEWNYSYCVSVGTKNEWAQICICICMYCAQILCKSVVNLLLLVQRYPIRVL